MAWDSIRRTPKIYPAIIRHHVEATIDLVSTSVGRRTRAKHAVEQAYNLGYDLDDLRTMPHQDLRRFQNLGRHTLELLVRAGIVSETPPRNRREALFMKLVRKRFGEKVCRALWEEVDRLEKAT